MARPKILIAVCALLPSPNLLPQTRPNVVLQVIGVTGAGKTTFVSRATGDNSLEINDGVDSGMRPHPCCSTSGGRSQRDGK